MVGNDCGAPERPKHPKSKFIDKVFASCDYKFLAAWQDKKNLVISLMVLVGAIFLGAFLLYAARVTWCLTTLERTRPAPSFLRSQDTATNWKDISISERFYVCYMRCYF